MGHIRSRSETKMLYFDFMFLGIRCREQTKLLDTQINRSKLSKVMTQIQTEIDSGAFKYEQYFPNGAALKKIKDKLLEVKNGYTGLPTLEQFSNEWYGQMEVGWRRSTKEGYRSYLDKKINPYFGNKDVSRITKADILEFRSYLAKVSDGKLKPKTINKVMKFLKMVIDEAASRFNFTSPYQGIKPLKEQKVHIEPFSLADVNKILNQVRLDWKPYLLVRFFTGLRTGEADGLKWQYVDFENRQILVRETFSKGCWEYTKNDGSQREVEMSQLVFETLKSLQEKQQGKYELVFVSPKGEPINNSNFLNRVWKPLLNLCGLKYRRPYQTRHTAATLWLAAGENPSWIAQQMGHSNTDMLFKVYARYVPNMTRQDGSAMESLIMNNFNQHQLSSCVGDYSTACPSISQSSENTKETDSSEINFWDSLLKNCNSEPTREVGS